MDTINQKIDDIILNYKMDRYYPAFRKIRRLKKDAETGDYTSLVSWRDEYCGGVEGFQKNRRLMERADLTVQEANRILVCLDKETNPDRRKEYLQRIIFLAIYKRNFLLAEEMLQRLEKEFPDMDDYRKAWNEICTLVESVKRKVKARKTRDIVGIWLDAISYQDREEVPWLEECSEGEHTISFTQAYTMTPFTNPTLTLILTGKRRIDDKSYLIKNIDRNNSEVIKLLEDTGHQCVFVGSYWKQIGDSYKSKANHYIFAPCSEVLWDMVCNLSESPTKTFILTHIFSEMHVPYFSMNQRKESDCEEKMRRIRGRQEVDRQLRYYMDFVGVNAVRMFFSDHGDKWQSKDVFHTVLEIQHKNYKKEKIDEIFSYAAFPELLKQIAVSQVIDKKPLVSDYAEVQELPLYDKNSIRAIIENQWGIFNHQLWGYRGVIDRKFVYLCHKRTDGNIEENLINNDEKTNDQFGTLFFPGYCPVISEEAVPHYRAIVEGKKCVDDEKLKYSRYLQKVAEKALPEHEKKIQMVRRLFAALPKHGVAFRGGGVDTGRILCFYKSELGGVDYIIDNNKSCLCAKLGIPIISFDEAAQKPINTVILGSKKLSDVFRNEIPHYPSCVRVVDVYQYLSDNGLNERAPFYFFQPHSKDYDVGFPFEEKEGE